MNSTSTDPFREVTSIGVELVKGNGAKGGTKEAKKEQNLLRKRGALKGRFATLFDMGAYLSPIIARHAFKRLRPQTFAGITTITQNLLRWYGFANRAMGLSICSGL